jgi:hypothetical protein
VGSATGWTPMTLSTGRMTARLQRPTPERSWMQRTFFGSVIFSKKETSFAEYAFSHKPSQPITSPVYQHMIQYTTFSCTKKAYSESFGGNTTLAAQKF